MSLHGVAPDRVYSDGRLARHRVSSYLTFPPLPLQLSCNGKGGKAGLAGSLSHYPPRGAQRRMALTSTVQLQWRYISVALFLGSPPAGVTRYPCPVEPGLSSQMGLSPHPRGCPACLPDYDTGKSPVCQTVSCLPSPWRPFSRSSCISLRMRSMSSRTTAS